jgi:hypothetical protein
LSIWLLQAVALAVALVAMVLREGAEQEDCLMDLLPLFQAPIQ